MLPTGKGPGQCASTAVRMGGQGAGMTVAVVLGGPLHLGPSPAVSRRLAKKALCDFSLADAAVKPLTRPRNEDGRGRAGAGTPLMPNSCSQVEIAQAC